MDKAKEILSEITVFMKYARYLPEKQRRETWFELVKRNADMHAKKYPELSDEIYSIYEDFVLTKKVLPSMRSMQFGGKAINRDNNRIYNCAFLHAKNIRAFPEVMYLLLGGSGVGFSVQKHHVSRLPCVRATTKDPVVPHVIPDTIEGWADAVAALCYYYFGVSNMRPIMDYSQIREKGARLVTSGGKAPGPEPLKVCIERMEALFRGALGRHLRPIEVHDLLCFIADAVLAGGIRRAALISLFSFDDNEMMKAKSGDWWEKNPQRARANNSVIALRKNATKQWFMAFFKKVEDSGFGEPGIYWTEDLEWGTNPCAEIALQDCQFCNLTEINASDIDSQEELEARAAAASFIGTLQAGYTNFRYLREKWAIVTREEALIGVGATGIASNNFLRFDLRAAAEVVKAVNSDTAKRIGINEAARTTCVKPSGTTSLVLGTSSGVHAWHAPYYWRRMRVMKSEAIYSYLKEYHPYLLSDAVESPDTVAVISVPQAAPEHATLRSENVYDMLTRVRQVYDQWVLPGHRSGANTHNVSTTVSIKDGNWEGVGEWMWGWRESYHGIAVMPHFTDAYPQMPFEDATAWDYHVANAKLQSIDLSQVLEIEDDTDLLGEAACAGGACEVTYA